jgi:hypothetical protein
VWIYVIVIEMIVPFQVKLDCSKKYFKNSRNYLFKMSKKKLNSKNYLFKMLKFFFKLLPFDVNVRNVGSSSEDNSIQKLIETSKASFGHGNPQ